MKIKPLSAIISTALMLGIVGFATANKDTGGSAAGDFGPPQGAPRGQLLPAHHRQHAGRRPLAGRRRT